MLFKISIIRVRARALTLALALFCVQVNSLFHYNVFFYTLSAVDRFHWQAYASILLRLDSLSAFSVFQQHFYKHVVSTQGHCYNRQAETQRRGVAGTRASFLAPPPPSANPSNIQFATYSWRALDLAPLPWSSSETQKSHLHLYPHAARAREAKTNQTCRPADCGACLSLLSCLSQADLEGVDAVV